VALSEGSLKKGKRQLLIHNIDFNKWHSDNKVNSKHTLGWYSDLIIYNKKTNEKTLPKCLKFNLKVTNSLTGFKAHMPENSEEKYISKSLSKVIITAFKLERILTSVLWWILSFYSLPWSSVSCSIFSTQIITYTISNKMFGGYGNENMDTVAKYEAIEQRLHQYPHILPKKHFVSEGGLI
jgi:hypothetical protein